MRIFLTERGFDRPNRIEKDWCSPTASCNGSDSSRGDKPPARAQSGDMKEYRKQAKITVRNSIIYICTRALHSFLHVVNCHPSAA